MNKKQQEFLDRLADLLERNCNCGSNDQINPAPGVTRAMWCDPCPPLPPVRQQYEQALARFNDSVSQTSAQAQAAQLQAHQTWSAHMLKLQADITNPPSQ